MNINNYKNFKQFKNHERIKVHEFITAVHQLQYKLPNGLIKLDSFYLTY